MAQRIDFKNLSAADFDRAIGSLAKRGATLQSDTQYALMFALTTWADSENHNPQYVTKLYRVIESVKGLNARKLRGFVEQHTSLTLKNVKGEVKFCNGDEFSIDAAAMATAFWYDWKSPAADDEFVLDTYLAQVAKKLAKNEHATVEAVALLKAKIEQIEADAVKKASK